MDETREIWIDRHSKRKSRLLSDLEKYFRVRNKSKIEILNLRFDFEIKRLQSELHEVNELLEVI